MTAGGTHSFPQMLRASKERPVLITIHSEPFCRFGWGVRFWALNSLDAGLNSCERKRHNDPLICSLYAIDCDHFSKFLNFISKKRRGQLFLHDFNRIFEMSKTVSSNNEWTFDSYSDGEPVRTQQPPIDSKSLAYPCSLRRQWSDEVNYLRDFD